jgi:hypothetical protein
MRKVIDFRLDQVTPTAAEVLENQGMAGRANIPERIRTLLEEAFDLFKELAAPRGVMADLNRSEFEAVYRGRGLNDPDTPVQQMYPQARALALFAVTLGDALSQRTTELFAKGGPALGFMLEAVTTSGAERLGNLMSRQFRDHLSNGSIRPDNLTVMHYSPGNCGWHISSQEKIFPSLDPGEIGITLTPAFHMRPLKSLSGVLIAASQEVHCFKPAFSICAQCKTHKCTQRIARISDEN